MFSPGIDHALHVSIRAHDGQHRKGPGEVPYVVHPVHAALMLARLDADEETIQAAILHDVVEDCADWTIERVADEFGDRVSAIVSDLTEDKSKTWEERKRHAVDHIEHMSAEAALVKAADKLHNLSSLVAHLAEADDHSQVWMRFRGGRDRTIAMSDELVRALVPRVPERLAHALEEVLRELRRTVKLEPE